MQTMKDMEARLAQFQKKQEETQQKYQEQLKTLEEKKTTTEEEQKAKKEEIKKLKKWREEQQQKEQERIQKEQEALKIQKELEEKQKKEEAEAEQKKKEEAEQKKIEEERKRLEEERNRVTEGQLIPLIDAAEKPVKVKGKLPKFPGNIRNRYAGNKDINIRVNILIDENGKVANVRILSKSPEDIKKVIVRTLKKWHYKPATKNNVRVKVWKHVSFKISF